MPTTHDLSASDANNFYTLDNHLEDIDRSRKGLPLQMGRSNVLLELAYANCKPFQHNRECFDNAVAAGATEVRIEPDFVYVSECVRLGKTPVYRWSCWDNGVGMSKADLVYYMRTLYASSKIHDKFNNFGIGARISLIVPNPYGVIYMSWQNGQGWMVQLGRNTAGDYVLIPWTDPDTGQEIEAIPTPEAYNTDTDTGERRESGTLVIALGDGPECNTYSHFPGQKYHSGRVHTKTLNCRYWEIPEGVRVWSWEAPGINAADKKAGRMFPDPVKDKWPVVRGRTTFRKTNDPTSGKLSHGGSCRQVFGVARHLDNSKRLDKGSVALPSGVLAHWFTYVGDRIPSGALRCNNANAYAEIPGVIGVTYKGEVYGTNRSDGRFKQFGVAHREARQRLAIMIELPENAPVVSDQSRSILRMSEDAKPLPWSTWGKEFFQYMPPEVRRLIAEVIPDGQDFSNTEVSIEAELTALAQSLGAGGPGGKGKGLGDVTHPKGNEGARGKLKLRFRCTSGICGHSFKEFRKDDQSAPDCPLCQSMAARVKTPSRRKGFMGRVKIPSIRVNSDPKPKYTVTWAPELEDGTLFLNLGHKFFRDVMEPLFEDYPQQGAEEMILQATAKLYGRNIGAKVIYAQLYNTPAYPDWDASDVEKLFTPEALTMATIDLLDAVKSLRSMLGGIGPKMPNSAGQSG
ncbi:ATP-binding protein [Deltaproteobacteria bacterium]|nr:ATP-binding protein [Deltaproteobacteria bacterium]